MGSGTPKIAKLVKIGCGLWTQTTYADDTQIYAVRHPTGTTQLQQQMSACIDDVAMWMRSNRLQLNTAKTEVIWCSSSRRQDQIREPALRVGSDSATLSSTGI